jgi:hypothetical protein
VIGPYKSGHTGAKCLHCLKPFPSAKPTDLEEHLANRYNAVSAEVKTQYLRVVAQRYRDINNDIQTITTTSTASTSSTTTATTPTSNNKK